jgi:hypothetical protein
VTRHSRPSAAWKAVMVIEKTNIATDTATLIIPGVASNGDRHARLQRFMLANDSTTVAVALPIWLGENDIAALKEQYGFTLVPKTPSDPAGSASDHEPRSRTRHIDILQVRNGAIHILDYTPDAHEQAYRAAHHLRAGTHAPCPRPAAVRYQVRLVQRELLQRILPPQSCREGLRP